MGELEEVEKKIKELKAKRAKAEPDLLESGLTWFALIVCAPWLLVVAENFGRNGWGFDQWDKWRLHWIPLTYVLYFGLGFLLFPTVNYVLYIAFPVILAVGLAGYIVAVISPLPLSIFLVAYAITVFAANKLVTGSRARSRERADRKKVLEEGFIEE